MLRACELSFENRQNTPVPADNEIAYCSFWWVFLLLKWCTTWLIWKISVSLFCATVLLVFVKVNEEELMNINFNTASASKSSGSTLYDLSGSVELVHAWSEKETDTGSHPDGHQVPCLYVRPLASIYLGRYEFKFLFDLNQMAFSSWLRKYHSQNERNQQRELIATANFFSLFSFEKFYEFEVQFSCLNLSCKIINSYCNDWIIQ